MSCERLYFGWLFYIIYGAVYLWTPSAPQWFFSFSSKNSSKIFMRFFMHLHKTTISTKYWTTTTLLYLTLTDGTSHSSLEIETLSIQESYQITRSWRKRLIDCWIPVCSSGPRRTLPPFTEWYRLQEWLATIQTTLSNTTLWVLLSRLEHSWRWGEAMLKITACFSTAYIK